jgi:hypothetical protein
MRNGVVIEHRLQRRLVEVGEQGADAGDVLLAAALEVRHVHRDEDAGPLGVQLRQFIPTLFQRSMSDSRQRILVLAPGFLGGRFVGFLAFLVVVERLERETVRVRIERREEAQGFRLVWFVFCHHTPSSPSSGGKLSAGKLGCRRAVACRARPSRRLTSSHGPLEGGVRGNPRRSPPCEAVLCLATASEPSGFGGGWLFEGIFVSIRATQKRPPALFQRCWATRLRNSGGGFYPLRRRASTLELPARFPPRAGRNWMLINHGPKSSCRNQTIDPINLVEDFAIGDHFDLIVAIVDAAWRDRLNGTAP